MALKTRIETAKEIIEAKKNEITTNELLLGYYQRKLLEAKSSGPIWDKLIAGTKQQIQAGQDMVAYLEKVVIEEGGVLQ